MKKEIDWTKPLQTIGGMPFEILTLNAKDVDYPVVGYVDSSMNLREYTLNGCVRDMSSIFNLTNVPEYVEMWQNIYENGAVDGSRYNSNIYYSYIYSTKEEADRSDKADNKRIDCIKIKVLKP
jgi:hypothetical protein